MLEMIDFGVKRADFDTSNILSFYTTLSFPYLPKSHPLSHPLSCPSYPITHLITCHHHHHLFTLLLPLYYYR